MVNGPGRGRPPLLWFLGGALIGGVTSGAGVGIGALLIPSVPSWVSLALLGLIAALVLLRDSGIVAVPFPQNPRQVRQSVLRMHPASGALMFGFELGTGARTYMTGAAPFIAIMAVLTTQGHGLFAGVLAGAGFGLGRGLIPLDRRFHRGEDAWDHWIRRHGNRDDGRRRRGIALTQYDVPVASPAHEVAIVE